MRLSPWQIFGPLAVAVVVLAVVTLHQAAPESCGQADESLDSDLYKQAQGLYKEILKEEPDSDCAAAGMETLVNRLCFRATTLARNENTEQADKIFASLLEMEPPGRALACAGRQRASVIEDPDGGGEEPKCECTVSCPGPGEDDDEPAGDTTIDDRDVVDDRDVGILGLGVVLRLVVQRDKPDPHKKPRKVHPKPCPWPG
jgi:hypothetical protein